MKNIFNLVLALSMFGMTLQANAALPAYTFFNLGTLGGSSSYAHAINNFGQVVGNSWTVDREVHATLWNDNVATDLGALGGDFSIANDINDSGQIVGYASGVFRPRGVLWNGTTVTDLGADLTNATSINNVGKIVGVGPVFVAGNGYNTQNSFQEQALLLDGATITNLGTFGGLNSGANAINNAGQIVGFAEITVGNIADNDRLAALWNGTTATILGDCCNLSIAYAINDAGRVAGYSVFAGGGARATVWNENTTIDLGTLGGNQSFAWGINEIGQVVGSANISANSPLRATLWNDTSAIDLNNFLDASNAEEWLLYEAKDINDNGWIVGNAMNKTTGHSHAFLLAPVPEPETYCMLFMGLGLISFVARRRNRQTV